MADSPPPLPPSRYQPQPVANEAPRNGLGIAALILGSISVLSNFGRFDWFAAILGIIGLILGFIGYGRFQRNEATNGTTALWGIIASAVAVLFSFVGVLFLTGGSADGSDEPSGEAADTASPAERLRFQRRRRRRRRRSPKRSTSTTSRWATVLPR